MHNKNPERTRRSGFEKENALWRAGNIIRIILKIFVSRIAREFQTESLKNVMMIILKANIINYIEILFMRWR